MQKSFLIVNEGEDKFHEDLTEPMPEFNFFGRNVDSKRRKTAKYLEVSIYHLTIPIE